MISRVPREAEDRLDHADTVGRVQREVRKAEEECRNVEATALNNQVIWTRWENGMGAQSDTKPSSC